MHRILHCSILVPLLCLVLYAPCFSGETVTIASGNFPPYTGKDLKEFGAANEIVTKAFLAVGIEPEFVFMPWKRVERGIESGRQMCSTIWMDTEERREFAIFSEPVIPIRNVVFYSKENLGTFIYSSLDDLKELKVGGIGGYFYVPIFQNNGIEMEESNSLESLVHKIHLKRIDVFVDDELVGWTVIKNLYPNELHKFASTAESVWTSDNKLICSKKHTDSERILKKFNEGLQLIKDSGVYDKTLQKYK